MDSFYISNKMSLTMEEMIGTIGSLEELERMFPSEMLKEDTRLGDYLARLLDKYGARCHTVSEQACLDGSYVGHIVNGKRNNPTRDALISICIAVGATVEEAQYLLRYAGHSPLYVRRRRDVIIWFGLMKKMSVTEVNLSLAERGLSELSPRRKKCD